MASAVVCLTVGMTRNSSKSSRLPRVFITSLTSATWTHCSLYGCLNVMQGAHNVQECNLSTEMGKNCRRRLLCNTSRRSWVLIPASNRLYRRKYLSICLHSLEDDDCTENYIASATFHTVLDSLFILTCRDVIGLLKTSLNKARQPFNHVALEMDI